MKLRKLSWNEKLSTELCSLDRDHKNLIEAFNVFVDALDRNEPSDKLLDMFQAVINELFQHFAFEEKMMENIGFKEMIEHKQHHETLNADAVEVLSELRQSESPEDILASVNFLRALIMKHMVEQDLKIRDFILRGL
ncbi:bacteriohemerythrin [Terasakiella pusilla]|uniref:bacteriohemerythrin n=1 Tax=Terasakiella pusilla TaxID=64973 RepID=UPI003AA9446E